MKKILALIICALLIATLACGCGSGEKSSNSEKIKIVTTIFPVYDWVKNIVGDNDNVDITMLLDSGVDLHSYQPSAQDMITISECDMFIYVGGESDKWVGDALKVATNKDMKVINIMDLLGEKALEEEEKEGMQKEEEEEEEEGALDEHVWLSLKNARVVCGEFIKAIGELDKNNSETYKLNGEKYIAKIVALDEEYKQVTDNAKVKTLVFADRFPFAYMFKDYGLDYYAAFKGCSAETSASFDTVIFLSGKVNELKLKYIMKIESSDGALAKTVKDSTKAKNQEIVAMNSLQSVTKADVDSGADYIELMKENLTVLKKVTQ